MEENSENRQYGDCHILLMSERFSSLHGGLYVSIVSIFPLRLDAWFSSAFETLVDGVVTPFKGELRDNR